MQMRMRIRINMRIEGLDEEEREPHGSQQTRFLERNQAPSDQISQPGHLASTCVHHNIGNELTVEVN